MKEVMKFRVEVGPWDIRRGVVRDLEFCPIARATKRALKMRMSDSGVTVSDEDISVYKPDTLGFGSAYALTSRARTFIERFDTGKSVRPFSFVARLMQ